MHAPRLRVRVAATFQKRSREEKRQCATVKNFAENSHFQPQIFLLIRRSTFARNNLLARRRLRSAPVGHAFTDGTSTDGVKRPAAS